MKNKMIDQLFKCFTCGSNADVTSNLAIDIEKNENVFFTKCTQCESSWKYSIGISEAE